MDYWKKVNKFAIIKIYTTAQSKGVDIMSSINAAMQSQIASVQQAINLSGMRQSMNQNASTVSKLVEGMEETSQAVQQARAAGPAKGQNVNLMA